MKKEYLKKKYAMQADAQMMERAMKDSLSEKEYGYYRTVLTYTNGVQLDCKIEENILFVGIYLTEYMRAGSPLPAYLLLIDFDKDDFVTWDRVNQKWRTATWYSLNWPKQALTNPPFISKEANQRLKDYLHTESDGDQAIWEFQRLVRYRQMKARHKRETDAWDKMLDPMPELPKDWRRWAEKYGIKQNYIFYDYSRKKKQEGYCSWCEKMVPISGKPRHNQMGVCKCCGRTIQFKAIGRAGRFRTTPDTVYLLQMCGNYFAIRQFRARRWYSPNAYKTPEVDIFEERRVLYDQDWNATVFHYGNYKGERYRWIKGERTYFFFNHEDFSRDYRGNVYRKNLSWLAKKNVGRTGLIPMIRTEKFLVPERFLNEWKRYPFFEQLSKAGLFSLIQSIMEIQPQFEFKPERSLARSLGIDKGQLRRLRDNKGDFIYLLWLQYEKQIGRSLKEDVLAWFQKYEITASNLKFILPCMSPEAICHYLERQFALSGRKPKELISTWEDYLQMADYLKWDIRKEIFYKPKNLLNSHQKAVNKTGGVDFILEAIQAEHQFPHVKEICQSIKTKYEYEDKEYRLTIPEGIRDIFSESSALNLCIHTSASKRYMDRIERREAYLAFLRCKKNPCKPFYILEFEPGGTIRQKRTVNDTQDERIEQANGFLEKWQRTIQKRLTEEDRRLADLSAQLRIQELAELREKKAKIWHGSLAGRLLADVLEQDLMEAVIGMEEQPSETVTNAA